MTMEEELEYWRKQHPLDVNLNALMDFFIAQLKAKEEHIKDLQDSYIKLDGKYLKLLEELKENK